MHIVKKLFEKTIDMTEKTRPLSHKQEHEIIELFSELGMPKNMAKTLLYISQVDQCRSVDIEKQTNLLQPQVSVAIQELRKRGWVEKQDMKKKGKGRPVHHYKLTKKLSRIVSTFEQQKLKEIQEINQNVNELKALIQERT